MANNGFISSVVPQPMKINDSDILTEFQTDPAQMGYAGDSKHNDGFKETKELIRLLGSRPLVPNPDPPSQVPKPPDLITLLGLIPDDEIIHFSHSLRVRLREMVEEGDTLGLALEMQLMVKRKESGIQEDAISQATKDNLDAEFQQTIPDPDHQAEVYKPNTPRTNFMEGGGLNKNPRFEDVHKLLGRSENG